MTTKDLEVIQKRFPEYRLLHMRPDMTETEEAFDIFQDAIMKGEFSQFHPTSDGNGGTLMGYPLQYHGLASIVVSHGSSTTLWISVHPREMLCMARHGNILGETSFRPGVRSEVDAATFHRIARECKWAPHQYPGLVGVTPAALALHAMWAYGVDATKKSEWFDLPPFDSGHRFFLVWCAPSRSSTVAGELLTRALRNLSTVSQEFEAMKSELPALCEESPKMELLQLATEFVLRAPYVIEARSHQDGRPGWLIKPLEKFVQELNAPIMKSWFQSRIRELEEEKASRAWEDFEVFGLRQMLDGLKLGAWNDRAKRWFFDNNFNSVYDLFDNPQHIQRFIEFFHFSKKSQMPATMRRVLTGYKEWEKFRPQTSKFLEKGTILLDDLPTHLDEELELLERLNKDVNSKLAELDITTASSSTASAQAAQGDLSTYVAPLLAVKDEAHNPAKATKKKKKKKKAKAPAPAPEPAPAPAPMNRKTVLPRLGPAPPTPAELRALHDARLEEQRLQAAFVRAKEKEAIAKERWLKRQTEEAKEAAAAARRLPEAKGPRHGVAGSRRGKTTEEARQHDDWISDEAREIRRAYFEAKQLREHSEAEARRAKERADKLEKAENQEANKKENQYAAFKATPPPAPSLADAAARPLNANSLRHLSSAGAGPSHLGDGDLESTFGGAASVATEAWPADFTGHARYKMGIRDIDDVDVRRCLKHGRQQPQRDGRIAFLHPCWKTGTHLVVITEADETTVVTTFDADNNL